MNELPIRDKSTIVLESDQLIFFQKVNIQPHYSTDCTLIHKKTPQYDRFTYRQKEFVPTSLKTKFSLAELNVVVQCQWTPKGECNRIINNNKFRANNYRIGLYWTDWSEQATDWMTANGRSFAVHVNSKCDGNMFARWFMGNFACVTRMLL